MTDRPCPVCRGETTTTLLPVAVRRRGRTVAEFQVPAAHCRHCGHVDVDEATQEEVIAALERHSEPGDDLVFPTDDG
jgi:YgiT-type zinc finger domain-containing protein